MTKSNLTKIAAACLVAATFASCGEIKRGEYVDGPGAIFCDDGFKNVLQDEIEAFEYTYKQASIIPFFMPEQACIDSLLEDKVQSIIVTQELKPEQREYLKKKYKRIVKSSCIAVDAVALITNKDNAINSLDMEDIRKILNGEITKWSQLGGNDTTEIKIVFDAPESSTVSYMKEKFLPKGRKISDNKNAYAQKNNAQVFDVVKTDRDALGIISVSWLGDNLQEAKKVPIDKKMEDYKNETDTVAPTLTEEVKILKVANPNPDNDYSSVAYKPYQIYINSGEYPLFRKVYMISTASNSTVLHSFYIFVSGFVGQKIISLTGIMPYKVSPRVVEVTQ